MVGALRAQVVGPLRSEYGAVELAELDPADAAVVEVAVTSGVWGVRREHLDRLPGLRAIVNAADESYSRAAATNVRLWEQVSA